MSVRFSRVSGWVVGILLAVLSAADARAAGPRPAGTPAGGAARGLGYQVIDMRRPKKDIFRQVRGVVCDVDVPKLRRVLAHSNVNGEHMFITDSHLGMGQGSRAVGTFQPNEDFRRPDLVEKRLDEFNTKYKGKNRTLTVGGDLIDMMEAVPADASKKQVKQAVDGIAKGQRVMARALFKSIALDDMRMVLVAGNHDVHVVDPAVRDRLINQMAKIGFHELLVDGKHDPRELAAKKSELIRLFKDRIAYAGWAAPLGKQAQIMHIHGHGVDPYNAFDSWVLPLDPKGRVRNTFGWSVVNREYKAAERDFDARADNREDRDPSAVVIHRVLKAKGGLRDAARFVKDVLANNTQRQYTPEEMATKAKLDDYAMAYWVKATGFGERQNAKPGLQPKTAGAWAKLLTGLTMEHKPVHAYMTSKYAAVNAAKIMTGGKKQIVDDAEHGMVRFLDGLTKKTGVRVLVTGHDHAPQAVNVKLNGEWHGYLNAGTLIENGSKWNLSFGRTSTDSLGHLWANGRGARAHKNGADGVVRITATNGSGLQEPDTSSNWHLLPRTWVNAMPESFHGMKSFDTDADAKSRGKK